MSCPRRTVAAARRALAPTALALALGLSAAARAQAPGDSIPAPGAPVFVLRLHDAIGPASARFVMDGIDKAEERGATCFVIELDTPGGLDSAMREMVKRMLAADVPIVVYVSPSGSRAASAGLFLLLAAHVAAMAPGTNTGAAHPVNMGGGPMDSVMTRKVENDAASFIRSLAQKHGRNPDWAETAVRASASISDAEALELGVIDRVEPSLRSLITALDGEEVELVSGPRVLHTAHAAIERLSMGWRDRVLSAIANPNVAYLLLMLGTAGLMMELWNPGAIFPGVVGAISMLLAFFALQVLPVNSVGLLLLALGIILLILEVKVTSYGALTIGGVVSLTLGSIFLFESRQTLVRVSWSVVVPTVIAITLFFLFVVGKGLLAQKRKPVTGTQGMLGEVGTADTALDPEGRVLVHGEYWKARAEAPIPAGARVEVVAVEGLLLVVRPV